MEAVSMDMWTPYKELCSTVENCILEPTKRNFSVMQISLQKHKQNFLTIIKNPPKNSNSHSALTKGITEGISLPSLDIKKVPKDVANEAFVLSEMYNLDELVALDLLCTAQQQMPSYPGLPRGLVAVLLYYDGHKTLARTLRTIMQARSGIQWSVDVPLEIPRFFASYSDELVTQGLIQHILDTICKMDLAKEIELLQSNRALGDQKHRHAIISLFEDTRQLLADVVFLYSAQAGLSQQPLLALINHMRDVIIEGDAGGEIDNASLALQMALLYGIEVDFADTTNGAKNAESPIIGEHDLLEKVIEEATNETKTWKSEGLLALFRFSLSITVANLRAIPRVVCPKLVVEAEENLLTLSLKGNVFKFLSDTFLRNATIREEEFYTRRIHSLICDFIVLMPFKIKELISEEVNNCGVAQMHLREGIEPPGYFARHFDHLLRSMVTLYDSDPLKLELHMWFWFGEEASSKDFKDINISQKVTLYKFLKQTREVLVPIMFVSYLNLIAALTCCEESARLCFKFLNSEPGNNMSWSFFFQSFHNYHGRLCQEQPVTDTVYRSRVTQTKGINPHELMALQAVLNVVRKVTDNNASVRLTLCQNQDWNAIALFIGLVSCSIELKLKADLVSTVASLAKSEETAAEIWRDLEAAQILITKPSTNQHQPRSVQSDLEEIESHIEEYPLTRAMLKLLDSLTDSPIPKLLGLGHRVPGSDPYLGYIINSVFLRFTSRSYKDPCEKWIIGELCAKLVLKFIENYEPKLDDVVGSKFATQEGLSGKSSPPPGFRVMVSLCTNSDLTHTILWLIDICCNHLETYQKFPGKSSLELVGLRCLQILSKGLELQPKFINVVSSSNFQMLPVPLNKTLLSVNARSGNPDHLLNVTKFVMFNGWLPEHTLCALKILLYVTSYPIQQSAILCYYTATPDLEIAIRHGFVECLELEENQWATVGDIGLTTVVRIKEAIMKLILQCLPGASPNIAHYLLGFNLKDVKKTVIHQPGTLNTPKSCLHSILHLLNVSIMHRTKKCAARLHPRLLELSYRILYTLAANPVTSERVLRYARMAHNLLERHFALTPFDHYERESEINCMAWLMKTVAVELRALDNRGNVNKLQSWSKLFLQSALIDSNTFAPSRQFSNSPAISRQLSSDNEAIALDNKIFRLLELAHFTNESIDPLERSTIKQTDMSIHSAITSSYAKNYEETPGSDVIRFFDCWRRMTCVYIEVATEDILPFRKRFVILVELILKCMKKVMSSVPINAELATMASEALLILFANLKNHCIDRKKNPIAEIKENMKLHFRTYHQSIEEIYSYLTAWVFASANGAQTIRSNIYASLATYFELCQPDMVFEKGDKLANETLGGNESASFSNDLAFVLPRLKVGERLFEVVCQDTTANRDITKMLALCCAGDMFEIEPKWLSLMSSRGHLKCLIRSLLDLEERLSAVLSPNAVSLAPLYVYECKMLFLQKMATFKRGAELLLEENTLETLSSMEIYCNHPSIESFSQYFETDDLVPDMESRYLQILTPLLTLCKQMLLTLGSKHEICVRQIVKTIITYSDTFAVVLRCASPSMRTCYIYELADISSIIAPTFAANEEICEVEALTQAKRLQKLMLGLLSKLDINADTLKRVKRFDSSAITKSEILVTYLNIIRYALSYAQSLIGNPRSDQRTTQIILQPSLTDKDRRLPSAKKTTEDLNLSCVIKFSVAGIDHYLIQKQALANFEDQLSRVSNLSVDELKELLADEFISAPESQKDAFNKLLRLVELKKGELDKTYSIVESSFHILWAHLDYYMLRAIPSKSLGTPKQTDELGEAAWAITAKQLNELKTNLAMILDDKFSEKMAKMAADRLPSEKGFVEALLRRVKKLIQFVPDK